MKLDELKSFVLVESGQYLAPFEATLLSDTEFLRLVSTELAIYNNHKQYKVYKTISVDESGIYEFKSTRPDLKDLPVYITDVRAKSGFSGNRYNYVRNGGGTSRVDRYKEGLAFRQEDNFFYNKPVLYLPDSGTYEVCCAYDRWIDSATVGTVTDADIVNITADDYKFIKLVTAKFMISLGRSRRAFTIEGIPVSFDASEMVSSGEQIYSEVKDSIQETSNWSDVLLS